MSSPPGVEGEGKRLEFHITLRHSNGAWGTVVTLKGLDNLAGCFELDMQHAVPGSHRLHRLGWKNRKAGMGRMQQTAEFCKLA